MSKFFNIKYVFGLVLVGAVLLPSCAFRPTYNRKTMTGLNSSNAHFAETKEDVTVLVRKLTIEDCKDVFDGRNFDRSNNEIIPMQVTVRNNSNNSVLLKKKNIILPLLDNETVSNALHYKTGARSVASALFLPGGLVTGIVYGVMSKGGNANVDQDIERKSSDVITVDAGDSVSALIFVDEDGYRSRFNMSLKTTGSAKRTIDYKVAL